jgi:hypothetical protein
MLWRQGDVFISCTSEIPRDAIKQSHLVLADGELTGHRHQIEELRSAVLYLGRDEQFLEVLAPHADIVHPEHHTIRLKTGKYRVWRQREFDPLKDLRSRFVYD